MKKEILILTYILTAALFGCKKNAELELPYAEPKVVISSFISPQDSLIQVAVSLSDPLYNNPNLSTTFKAIPDAKVTITDGINTYNLAYNSKLERYVTDSFKLKIKSGNIYNLFVNTSDGKFAKASTTIPFLNNSLAFSITKNNAVKDGYYVRGKWSDNNQNNIDSYIFDVVYVSLSYFSGTNGTGNFNDTIRKRSTNFILVNDNDGQQFDETLDFTIHDVKKDSVYVDLITLSNEYVNYHIKLQKAIGALSTPFSEPVQMYTNIDGGLGVFAGMNRYSSRIFP